MKKADIETVFQSTLPVGEATSVREDASHADAISIHASREGSDPWVVKKTMNGRQFQSTLPAREATLQKRDIYADTNISIHASREGSDTIKDDHFLPVL